MTSIGVFGSLRRALLGACAAPKQVTPSATSARLLMPQFGRSLGHARILVDFLLTPLVPRSLCRRVAHSSRDSIQRRFSGGGDVAGNGWRRVAPSAQGAPGGPTYSTSGQSSGSARSTNSARLITRRRLPASAIRVKSSAQSSVPSFTADKARARHPGLEGRRGPCDRRLHSQANLVI